MLKVKGFKNVDFNEIFSYNGDIYKKILRDTNKPGAVRVSDGMIFNSCQNWHYCTVDRKEECAVESPKERKKYIFRDTESEYMYGLLLTDEQMALCRWLDEHEFLIDLNWEQVEDLNFTKI